MEQNNEMTRDNQAVAQTAKTSAPKRRRPAAKQGKNAGQQAGEKTQQKKQQQPPKKDGAQNKRGAAQASGKKQQPGQRQPRRAAGAAQADQEMQMAQQAAAQHRAPQKRGGRGRQNQNGETAIPVKIMPLGGLGEVGKNVTLYECQCCLLYTSLINFTSEPTFPAELYRVYKITDGVLRSLIIAKEEEEAKTEAK